MKQIFDSDYIKPDQNPRVLQDTSMQKSAAFDEALKRYEDTLRNDQSTVEKQKQLLQERVQSAERDKSNEKDKKRQA